MDHTYLQQLTSKIPGFTITPSRPGTSYTGLSPLTVKSRYLGMVSIKVPMLNLCLKRLLLSEAKRNAQMRTNQRYASAVTFSVFWNVYMPYFRRWSDHPEPLLALSPVFTSQPLMFIPPVIHASQDFSVVGSKSWSLSKFNCHAHRNGWLQRWHP